MPIDNTQVLRKQKNPCQLINSSGARGGILVTCASICYAWETWQWTRLCLFQQHLKSTTAPLNRTDLYRQ